MCRSLLFFLKLLNVAEVRVSFFPVFSYGEIVPGQEVKWVLIFTECNVNCGEVNIWFLDAKPVSLLLTHANWSWSSWQTVSTYSLFIGITYLYWSYDDVLLMMYWYCILWFTCQNYACWMFLAKEAIDSSTTALELLFLWSLLLYFFGCLKCRKLC